MLHTTNRFYSVPCNQGIAIATHDPRRLHFACRCPWRPGTVTAPSDVPRLSRHGSLTLHRLQVTSIPEWRRSFCGTASSWGRIRPSCCSTRCSSSAASTSASPRCSSTASCPSPTSCAAPKPTRTTPRPPSCASTPRCQSTSQVPTGPRPRNTFKWDYIGLVSLI